MVSMEHEPVMGVWGRSPSGVLDQSPWSEDEGGEATEAESMLSFKGANEVHIYAQHAWLVEYMFCQYFFLYFRFI